MRDNNKYHRHQTTNIQSAQYKNTGTTNSNKQYKTNRFNTDNDDNESYPSMGKDIIVTCNKKRSDNMLPRDRGSIDYSRDRGIDYDKQSSKRGISRNDYKNYEKNSYQREPSGTISKSYHREPSGMRISQIMDEERQPQNNNIDDYPYNNRTRDEYRDNAPLDNVLKEGINDDSWEISSRITSISNARSSSFPNNHEGIPKSIPTKIIKTSKSKGGIDCNASRMTG